MDIARDEIARAHLLAPETVPKHPASEAVSQYYWHPALAKGRLPPGLGAKRPPSRAIGIRVWWRRICVLLWNRRCSGEDGGEGRARQCDISL